MLKGEGEQVFSVTFLKMLELFWLNFLKRNETKIHLKRDYCV